MTEVAAAWTAAAFAALAAFVAIYQIRVQKVQARQQATFEHIRQVSDELHAVQGRDDRALRNEILAFASHKIDTLSEGALRYLIFLDAVDLLALALKHGIVDKDVVLEYLGSHLNNPYTFSEPFIVELRKAQQNSAIYEHTLDLLTEARSLKR